MHKDIKTESIEKLIVGYLEVYHQVKAKAEKEGSTPHELIMDVLFDTMQELKDELQKGKLGV